MPLAFGWPSPRGDHAIGRRVKILHAGRAGSGKGGHVLWLRRFSRGALGYLFVGRLAPCRRAWDQGIRGSLVDRRDLRAAYTIGSAAGIVGALALAAGCSGTATSAERAKGRVFITPSNGAREVRPGATVAVAARGARLRGVMVSTSGNALVGHLARGGTTWRSSGALALSRTYTGIALAVGTDGKKYTTTSSFRTLM